jgi:hypothetical protein
MRVENGLAGSPPAGELRNVETCIRRYEQPESFKLKQLGVVAERSEVAEFVLRHHTRMIAHRDGPVHSTRCSAANAVYRGGQWQRRSKHTELES